MYAIRSYYADKIVVLRDGRVEQVGAPLELYHNPVNQFVAGVITSYSIHYTKLYDPKWCSVWWVAGVMDKF